MKRLPVVGGIFASLLLGMTVTAIAQDEPKQDEHKNEQQAPPQENRKDQAKPEDRRNQEPQSGDRHPEQQQDERQMQQQEKQQQKMEKQQEKMDKQQGRDQERREQAQPQQSAQNGQQARAPRAENQRRISDHDFHAHFGHDHHFRPGRVEIFEGRPRFSYSGYFFELDQPWPAGWAYDDDCYVDYIDGDYWLFDLLHPGVRVMLVVVG